MKIRQLNIWNNPYNIYVNIKRGDDRIGKRYNSPTFSSMRRLERVLNDWHWTNGGNIRTTLSTNFTAFHCYPNYKLGEKL